MVQGVNEFEELVDRLGRQAKVKEWRYEKIKTYHYRAEGVVDTAHKNIKNTIIVLGMYNKGTLKVTVSQVLEGSTKDGYENVKAVDFDPTVPATLFYTFVASKETEFSTKNMLNLSRQFMTLLSAEEKEKLVEDKFVSLSAFSSQIDRQLPLANGEKMNVQMSMRSLQGKTVMTMGSPIIITEY